MHLQLAVVMIEGRVKLMRPMDPATVHDLHDLFAGFPKDVHDLMKVLAKFLGIKMGNDLIEDPRGPILHGTKDVEQHATGDPAPRTIADPGLAFEGLFTSDVTLAQWTDGKTGALSPTPPAQP